MMLRLVAITMVSTAEIAASTLAMSAEEGGHGAPPIAEDLSLWGFVAFAVFVFTCFKLLSGWASRSLLEREQTENALIDEAEQKNQRAQDVLAEHRGRMEAISEEVSERIAEAHRDADSTKREISALANREAGLLQTRAQNEIGRARSQALDNLFSNMAARVVERAEAKVKERLGGEEQDRLIDESLEQFSKQS